MRLMKRTLVGLATSAGLDELDEAKNSVIQLYYN